MKEPRLYANLTEPELSQWLEYVDEMWLTLEDISDEAQEAFRELGKADKARTVVAVEQNTRVRCYEPLTEEMICRVEETALPDRRRLGTNELDKVRAIRALADRRIKQLELYEDQRLFSRGWMGDKPAA